METYGSSQRISWRELERRPDAIERADEYAKHQIIKAMVEKLKADQIYTVRLRREERRTCTNYDPLSHLPDLEVRWTLDLGEATVMKFRTFKPVDYSAYEVVPLVRTASKEIRRRIERRWRRAVDAGHRMVKRVQSECGGY